MVKKRNIRRAVNENWRVRNDNGATGIVVGPIGISVSVQGRIGRSTMPWSTLRNFPYLIVEQDETLQLFVLHRKEAKRIKDGG